MKPPEREPVVIVDFVFEDGLLFIAIKNISARPAYDVAIKFNRQFTGVEGTKNISALPVFRHIPFLAPQKEIVVFLDTSASYFRRRQPTDIRVTITCKDASACLCKSVIRHDLAIYKDLGYIRRLTTVNNQQSSDDVQPSPAPCRTC